MSPSKIDSSRPFYPFRVYVLLPLAGVAVGWLLGTGAFGDVGATPTGTLPVCTTTTTTTPQR